MGKCMCTHIKLKGDDTAAIEKWNSECDESRKDSEDELYKKYPLLTKLAWPSDGKLAQKQTVQERKVQM